MVNFLGDYVSGDIDYVSYRESVAGNVAIMSACEIILKSNNFYNVNGFFKNTF